MLHSFYGFFSSMALGWQIWVGGGGGGGGGGRNIFQKKREYTDKFSGSMDVSGNAVCHSIDINLMKVVCLQMWIKVAMLECMNREKNI